MDNLLLTFFTPTYNRAETLKRLYNSLLEQKSDNFEWIIVDDGSVDKTLEVVTGFINDNKIKIRYYYQENQGKHIAINTGVLNAKGGYLLIIDSDDYLLSSCFESCEKLIHQIEDEPLVAGFTGIHFANSVLYDPNNYGHKQWFQEDEIYKWKTHGEMVYCYKTEILKSFPFPQFENEKFCPESLIHKRIAREYKVLYTDNIWARGDYLEDGLSSKYQNLLESSPRAAMLSFKEKIQYSENKHIQFINVKNYWNIAMRAKQISWIEKFRGISLKYSLLFWYNRLTIKNN